MIAFRVMNQMDGSCRWAVEYYLDDGTPWPLGTAYVLTIDDCVPWPAVMDYILVADHIRRQGIGTALLTACRTRWPGIYLTDPISDAGAALLRRFQTETGPGRTRKGVAYH